MVSMTNSGGRSLVAAAMDGALVTGESAAGEPPRLDVLDLRIAPGSIHYFKFILEGYDGLAALSTIDPQQGLVRLRFSVKVKHEVMGLLCDLKARIEIELLNVIHE